MDFLAENFGLIEDFDRMAEVQNLVTELPLSRHKLSKILIDEISHIHNIGLLSYGDFAKAQNLSFQLQKDTEYILERLCRLMDILQGSTYFSSIHSLAKKPPEGFDIKNYSLEHWLLYDWVTQAMAENAPKDLGLTFVLGEPSGLFCHSLLWSTKFDIQKLRNFSIKNSYEQISERILNHLVVADWFFKAGTFDPLEKEYYMTEWQAVNSLNHEGTMYEKADTIIHLSIEKLADFHKWYDKVPEGMNLVLMGSTDSENSENILPMGNVEELDGRTPKKELYFKGEYAFENHNKLLITFKK